MLLMHHTVYTSNTLCLFQEIRVSKFGYFIVIAIVVLEVGAMNFALANKTRTSFNTSHRIANPVHMDHLGNVIYKSE